METIGTRFERFLRGLPMPALPAFDWATAQNLFGPTIAIALLGAIESLLCARVADGLIGDRHDPNQELMAQGIGNFAAPFFGGIAVTGTIARTMTNVRSGARSPVAGLVHSITLMLVLLALAPAAGYIPLSALAAVLLWVAFNMVGWRELRNLPRFSMFYRTIVLGTLALTVVFDLTVAVEVGLAMSSFFYIYRVSSLTTIDPIALAPRYAASNGASVGAWEIFGSVFFGSVTKIEALADPARTMPDVVILDLRKVINFDTTGLDALEGLHETLERRGGRLLLADLNEQPLSLMSRSGFPSTPPLGFARMCSRAWTRSARRGCRDRTRSGTGLAMTHNSASNPGRWASLSPIWSWRKYVDALVASRRAHRNASCLRSGECCIASAYRRSQHRAILFQKARRPSCRTTRAPSESLRAAFNSVSQKGSLSPATLRRVARRLLDDMGIDSAPPRRERIDSGSGSRHRSWPRRTGCLRRGRPTHGAMASASACPSGRGRLASSASASSNSRTRLGE